MEKMKYEDFLKSIVNHKYHSIEIKKNLENINRTEFKIILKRGEWVIENNLHDYQNKTYAYNFEIDDIIDLMLDLLDTQEKEITNKISSMLKKLLKELDNE